MQLRNISFVFILLFSVGDSTNCLYDYGDPNVTCSFDKDPCGYTSYSQSGDTTWKWTSKNYNSILLSFLDLFSTDNNYHTFDKK